MGIARRYMVGERGGERFGRKEETHEGKKI
jgi:hypothetical protein